MREDVKVVINHFKKLYKNLKSTKNSSIADQVKDRRWIVENYGSIDGKNPIIDSTILIEKISVNNINCEWIVDTNADKNKRLLYIHGGAFIAGSLDSHRAMCCELSKRAKVAVLSVDYRLAPENPFPAGLDDCYEAYKWLIDNSGNEKNKAKKLFISGDSAGGNLSLALLLKIKAEGITMPNAVLPTSPVLDLLGNSDSVKSLDGLDPIINKKALIYGLPVAYLFGKDALKMDSSKIHKIITIGKVLATKKQLLKNPLVSPIYGDLSGLPPILINVGEIEVLRDDAIRFVDKARKQGSPANVKVWPHMIYVFIAFLGYLPEAEQCLDEMADFIKKYS